MISFQNTLSIEWNKPVLEELIDCADAMWNGLLDFRGRFGYFIDLCHRSVGSAISRILIGTVCKVIKGIYFLAVCMPLRMLW